MQSSVSIREFHQRYQKRLQLSFASGQVGLDKELRISTADDDSFQTVDYLNIIRPSNVVVIGQEESSYLASLNFEEKVQLFERLTEGPLATIILSANGRRPGAQDCGL